MNDQKPSMFMPALIGGGVAGLLSGVPIFNCLCCLWIIGGAILASYLLAKDSPLPLSAGDGAIVGIFTGIVAAFVEAVISIPFHALNRAFVQRIMEAVANYTEEMPAGWENWVQKGTYETTAAMFMLGLLISVVIFSILGILGGVIGVSLFGKKNIKTAQGASDVPQDSSNSQS